MDQYPSNNVPPGDGHSARIKEPVTTVHELPQPAPLPYKPYLLDCYRMSDPNVPGDIGELQHVGAFETKEEANMSLREFCEAAPPTWLREDTGTQDGMDWTRFSLENGIEIDVQVYLALPDVYPQNPKPTSVYAPRQDFLPAITMATTSAMASPAWAHTYEPGHLKDLDPPLMFDVYEYIRQLHPAGKKPYSGNKWVSLTTRRPSWSWIQYQLLARVPGGVMDEKVIFKMAQEWIPSLAENAPDNPTLWNGCRNSLHGGDDFVHGDTPWVWRIANIDE